MHELILWRSGSGLLLYKFCQFLTELSACDMSIFSFLDDNFSKYQWIFTKLGVCIDILETWFWIANGQISSFFIYLRLVHIFVLVNINEFSPNFGMCVDIVKIGYGIANGQISSDFVRVVCPQYICILLSGQ